MRGVAKRWSWRLRAGATASAAVRCGAVFFSGRAKSLLILWCFTIKTADSAGVGGAQQIINRMNSCTSSSGVSTTHSTAFVVVVYKLVVDI